MIVFFKKTNTIVGPNDDVLLPRDSQHLDWEVELGVLIRETCRYLDSAADALSSVGGYVLVNDVSERAFQLERSGGQWSKGKCAETFTRRSAVDQRR